MAKKSATAGKYIIQVKDDGSIEVYRKKILGVIPTKPIPDGDVKGALREIAEKIGFKFDPNWTTRQLGSKLIDEINK